MQHKLQAKLRLLVRNSYLIREADFPEWCLKTKRNDRTLTMQDHHGSLPYCISWQTGRYCYKYDLNQTADQQFSSKQWLAGLRVCGCAFSLRMTLRKHSSHCHLRFSKDWGLSTHCWLTWRTSRNRPLSNCVRTKEQRRGWGDKFTVSFVCTMETVNFSHQPRLFSFVRTQVERGLFPSLVTVARVKVEVLSILMN